MVIFYRTKDCPACRGIESALKAMTLAHKVVIVKGGSISAPGVPSGMKPPLLVDEKEIIQGREKILAHLEELEKFREEWYKFQSDACYCDEEGNII